MAGSYNKITLIGHLGRDPEMRYLSGGDPVTDFSVATSERRRGADGQSQEQTTWFRVSAFGKLAETCHGYLHKGSYVYVEGALSQRDWTDREGATRTSLEVRARELRLLDRRGDDEGALAPTRTLAAPPIDDDVPF
jgi:single-strand DNA-binding protein